MTPLWVRPGLATFLALCFTFAANLFLMQPPSRTYAPKRVEFGRASDEPATPATPNSRTIATASIEAPAAVPGFVPVVRRTPASEDRAVSEALLDSTAGDTVELTRAIQRELQAKGYESGAPDGVPGLVTRAAIMAYEADHAQPLTGEPSQGLLKQLVLGVTDGTEQQGTQSRQAEQVIRTVQQSLARLGFASGMTDGRMGEETVRAIREFEAHQGLPESGRVSGQLVARLARLAGEGRLADNR